MRPGFTNVFTLITLGLSLNACQSSGQEKEYPCGHSYSDERWAETNNFFYYNKGTYWIYKDSFSGRIDSQIVLDNEFHDFMEKGCQYDEHLRNGSMTIYSSLFDDLVYHKITSTLSNEGASRFVKISNPNGKTVSAFTYSSNNARPSYMLFWGKEININNRYFICSGFGGYYDKNYINAYWAYNIGLVSLIVYDTTAPLKPIEKWQLIREHILR